MLKQSRWGIGLRKPSLTATNLLFNLYMETLLQKAKTFEVKNKRRGKIATKQEMEIVLEWLDGKILLKQMEYAFNGKTNGGQFFKQKVLRIMRSMYEQGILVKK